MRGCRFQRQEEKRKLVRKENIRCIPGLGDLDFEVLQPFESLSQEYRKPNREHGAGSSAAGQEKTVHDKHHEIFKLLAHDFTNKLQLRESVYSGRKPSDPSHRLVDNNRVDGFMVAGLWMRAELVCAASLRVNLPQRGGLSRLHVQILFLATRSDHRRRGLARLLTRCILRAAAEAGHEIVTVAVQEEAKLYWQKVGFCSAEDIAKSTQGLNGSRAAVSQRAAEDGSTHAMRCPVWCTWLVPELEPGREGCADGSSLGPEDEKAEVDQVEDEELDKAAEGAQDAAEEAEAQGGQIGGRPATRGPHRRKGRGAPPGEASARTAALQLADRLVQEAAAKVEERYAVPAAGTAAVAATAAAPAAAGQVECVPQSQPSDPASPPPAAAADAPALGPKGSLGLRRRRKSLAVLCGTAPSSTAVSAARGVGSSDAASGSAVREVTIPTAEGRKRVRKGAKLPRSDGQAQRHPQALRQKQEKGQGEKGEGQGGVVVEVGRHQAAAASPPTPTPEVAADSAADAAEPPLKRQRTPAAAAPQDEPGAVHQQQAGGRHAAPVAARRTAALPRDSIVAGAGAGAGARAAAVRGPPAGPTCRGRGGRRGRRRARPFTAGDSTSGAPDGGLCSAQGQGLVEAGAEQQPSASAERAAEPADASPEVLGPDGSTGGSAAVAAGRLIEAVANEAAALSPSAEGSLSSSAVARMEAEAEEEGRGTDAGVLPAEAGTHGGGPGQPLDGSSGRLEARPTATPDQDCDSDTAPCTIVTPAPSMVLLRAPSPPSEQPQPQPAPLSQQPQVAAAAARACVPSVLPWSPGCGGPALPGAFEAAWRPAYELFVQQFTQAMLQLHNQLAIATSAQQAAVLAAGVPGGDARAAAAAAAAVLGVLGPDSMGSGGGGQAGANACGLPLLAGLRVAVQQLLTGAPTSAASLATAGPSEQFPSGSQPTVPRGVRGAPPAPALALALALTPGASPTPSIDGMREAGAVATREIEMEEDGGSAVAAAVAPGVEVAGAAVAAAAAAVAATGAVAAAEGATVAAATATALSAEVRLCHRTTGPGVADYALPAPAPTAPGDVAADCDKDSGSALAEPTGSGTEAPGEAQAAVEAVPPLMAAGPGASDPDGESSAAGRAAAASHATTTEAPRDGGPGVTDILEEGEIWVPMAGEGRGDTAPPPVPMEVPAADAPAGSGAGTVASEGRMGSDTAAAPSPEQAAMLADDVPPPPPLSPRPSLPLSPSAAAPARPTRRRSLWDSALRLPKSAGPTAAVVGISVTAVQSEALASPPQQQQLPPAVAADGPPSAAGGSGSAAARNAPCAPNHGATAPRPQRPTSCRTPPAGQSPADPKGTSRSPPMTFKILPRSFTVPTGKRLGQSKSAHTVLAGSPQRAGYGASVTPGGPVQRRAGSTTPPPASATAAAGTASLGADGGGMQSDPDVVVAPTCVVVAAARSDDPAPQRRRHAEEARAGSPRTADARTLVRGRARSSPTRSSSSLLRPGSSPVPQQSTQPRRSPAGAQEDAPVRQHSPRMLSPERACQPIAAARSASPPCTKRAHQHQQQQQHQQQEQQHSPPLQPGPPHSGANAPGGSPVQQRQPRPSSPLCRPGLPQFWDASRSWSPGRPRCSAGVSCSPPGYMSLDKERGHKARDAHSSDTSTREQHQAAARSPHRLATRHRSLSPSRSRATAASLRPQELCRSGRSPECEAGPCSRGGLAQERSRSRNLDPEGGPAPTAADNCREGSADGSRCEVPPLHPLVAVRQDPARRRDSSCRSGCNPRGGGGRAVFEVEGASAATAAGCTCPRRLDGDPEISSSRLVHDHSEHQHQQQPGQFQQAGERDWRLPEPPTQHPDQWNAEDLSECRLSPARASPVRARPPSPLEFVPVPVHDFSDVVWEPSPPPPPGSPVRSAAAASHVSETVRQSILEGSPSCGQPRSMTPQPVQEHGTGDGQQQGQHEGVQEERHEGGEQGQQEGLAPQGQREGLAQQGQLKPPKPQAQAQPGQSQGQKRKQQSALPVPLVAARQTQQHKPQQGQKVKRQRMDQDRLDLWQQQVRHQAQMQRQAQLMQQVQMQQRQMQMQQQAQAQAQMPFGSMMPPGIMHPDAHGPLLLPPMLQSQGLGATGADMPLWGWTM